VSDVYQVDHTQAKKVLMLQRNLIAYFYPRKNGHWRRTAEHLSRHWHQFDGRKVIAVATDQCCVEHAEVVDSLRAFSTDTEFMLGKNDPNLRETRYFLPALEQVIDQPGITFFCHAKGATHESPREAPHLWREAMAAACLEYPELVECAFSSGKHVCGAFMADGIRDHGWHFSGTWFWFRNERARSLNWRDVHQTFMGVEGWPGIFPREEAFCLFYERANAGQLYDRREWDSTITPSLECWRRSVEGSLCMTG